MADESRQSVGPLAVLASVFRAWFGVQSEANRERDFQQGSAGSFIVAGILFAFVMVLAVVLVVQWVLPT